MKNIKEITDIFKQEIKKKYTSQITMPIYMGVSDMEIILEEIERLNKELENLEKLNNANYQSFIETNKTIIELEKWIKEILLSKAYSIGYKEAYKDIYMKLQELKGSDKE